MLHPAPIKDKKNKYKLSNNYTVDNRGIFQLFSLHNTYVIGLELILYNSLGSIYGFIFD